MSEVRQLDVFGGETAVWLEPTVEPVVVVAPPPERVPSWWVQLELPLFDG
jgi:hypothetical protein